MANTEDFRYKATERALTAAFMELARERGIRSVTVSELCRRADISRNAFYLHYSDISALCCSMVGKLARSIEGDCLASTDRVLSTKQPDGELPDALFDSFARHEELIRMLLGTDDGMSSELFAAGLADMYAKSAARFGKSHERLEHRMMCSFSAWAHVGFLKRWIIETDRPLSDARACFIELQSKVMEPHYRLLAEGR